jgi:predicted XRE-type DNA-binding protein
MANHIISKVCFVADCPNKYFAKSFCNKHYRRWRNTGNPLTFRRNFGQGENTEERFWSRVIKSGKCWIWQGGVSPYGYGYVGYKGKVWQAHRLSWLLTFNKKPKFLLHSCDNKLCVNTLHLSEGNHTQNMADMVNKSRQARGERNGHSKLSESEAMEVIQMLKSKKQQKEIAAIFNIARPTVSSIATGKSWKHLNR